jgi:hypothetical protein
MNRVNQIGQVSEKYITLQNQKSKVHYVEHQRLV